jgi:hypothetical protein
VIAGFTCIVLGGCTLADPPDEPVSVHHDRLTFSDTQVFFSTIQELNALPADQAPSAYLEERFAGFHSLGDTERGLPPMTPAMRSVLNPDGSYQVGDLIYLILGSSEYRIPEQDEHIVGALVGGASDVPYVASGRIQVNRLAAKKTTETSNLLNAKYQREFGAAGHLYKFVHEAYVDAYATYLMACFRSKFEYKDGSTWRHAGEIIDKEIDLGTVDYWIIPIDQPAYQLQASTPYTSTVSPLEIVSCVQIVAPFGTCLSGAQLTAAMHAAGTQWHTVGQSYDVFASWVGEFASLQTCNK